jgi:hypothetical protein
MIGKAIGVLPVYLGDYLEPIQSFCLIHGLPPLTVLVVQEATGIPGQGFSASKNVSASQAEVFAQDWLEMHAPKPADFANAIADLPSNGGYDPVRLAAIRRNWS